ncbi:MAG: DUF218 domain-containing protein [Clostridiales bacterium]|nr:DUF218 domain-containing protein [Clostridiales bacterium]
MIKEWILVNILAIIFLVLGLFCFSYLLAIISYSGTDTDFLWFWLASGIACILLAIFLSYLRNHRIDINKYLAITLFALLILGGTFFALVEGTILYKGNSNPSKSADYVIVLGAQVKGTALSKALKSRLDTAVTYLNDNADSKVVVSGGQGRGEDIPEALAMKNYLISIGIKDSRIIMEDKSTNTEENIRFSQSIIADKDQYTVIVTNKFHIFRATMIARKQGMTNVKGLGAPSDDILVIHYHVREFFAVVKDKLIGNI